MSSERVQLLYLKGVISELEPDAQAKVAEIAAQLRDMLAGDGAGEAHLAIALVGLEAVVQAEAHHA